MESPEVLDLIQRAQQSPPDPAAIAELCRRYHALVHFWARRYHRHAIGHEYDDLVQGGFEGLLVGIQRFDPSYGTKLITVAVLWIRQRVQQAFIRPRANGKPVPHDSAFTDVAEVWSSCDPIHGTLELPDRRTPAPDQRAEEADGWRAVERALDCLHPRQRTAYVLHHGLGPGRQKMTLKAVGAILGVTRERVRQICLQAEERLLDHADLPFAC